MKRLAVCAGLAGAALAFAHYGFFFYRDNLITHYPLKVISAASFRAGQIPWWNLHDCAGQPLAGNPNALTFYPDNVLYLLFAPHAAFNLHFLIHLMFGFFAMRALCTVLGATRRAALFGATLYALSGAVVSSTAFYNLVVVVAVGPAALWGLEMLLRDRWTPWRAILINGAIFGLLGLAGEPVMVLSILLASVVVVAGRLRRSHVLQLMAAAAVAVIVAAPMILAWLEIAAETRRAVPQPVSVVLAKSLHPMRLVELVAWPIHGVLNDGGGPLWDRLFSTIFIGVIAIPALWQRSRYTLIAFLLLFHGLGEHNPLLPPLMEWMPAIRVIRYPEKLALGVTITVVLLAALWWDRQSRRVQWIAACVTFVPLIWVCVRALPVDWFRFYDLGTIPTVRYYVPHRVRIGVLPARDEYRLRANDAEPLFGAVSGLQYGANASGEGMHALWSEALSDAVRKGPQRALSYLQTHGCQNVPGALPMAMFVPRVAGVSGGAEAMRTIAEPGFDVRAMAPGPRTLDGFRSPPDARVFRYHENLQSIEIDVSAPGPALLMVNQTFFRGWVATSGGRELPTVVLYVDRLGVLVPAGQQTITLRFGRRRAAIIAAWACSSALLGLALLAALRKR